MKEIREDQILLGAVILLFSSCAYAFLSLPSTATLNYTAHAVVVSKDSGVSLMMFLPMGDNLTGVPMFDAVYRVTTSSGEQVNVGRDVYGSLDVGSPIVVKYWSKGWLDWKTCELI